jgi:hypothetical protein
MSVSNKLPGDLTVPTTKKGYESLLAWAESFGPIRFRCAGVEGTSRA